LLNISSYRIEHFLRAIDMINNEALENMLEQILEAFTLKIGQILQAERTTIFMVDLKKRSCGPKSPRVMGKGQVEIRVPIGRGIAGYVAASARSLNIPDAYADERFDRSHDKKTGYHTRTILCIAVINKKGSTVAVAAAGSTSSITSASTIRMSAASGSRRIDWGDSRKLQFVLHCCRNQRCLGVAQGDFPLDQSLDLRKNPAVGHE
jgi:hypothetical protein